MASPRVVLRRDRPVNLVLRSPVVLVVDFSVTIPRRREAIECYKRALIPADPHEININLKLANLYWSVDEFAEAVAYHRRVVEVCQADR